MPPRAQRRIPKEQLLRKYNDCNWEERRHECNATVKEKHFNPETPESTRVKRSELYFDRATDELVLSRVEFTSANGDVRLVIMSLLGDDGVLYTL